MAKFHYKDSPSPEQKKAFSTYLSDDEELVLITGFSKAYLRNKFVIFFLFPGIIFGLIGLGLAYILKLDRTWLIAIPLVLMLLIALIRTLHTYHANRYLLTTRRVMVKRGLFSVKLSAVLYDKITHLEVDQSFVDRMLLHHGNIIINTAGQNKNEMVLEFVDYPMEIKNLLERLINREREQFGTRGGVATVEGEIIS